MQPLRGVLGALGAALVVAFLCAAEARAQDTPAPTAPHSVDVSVAAGPVEGAQVVDTIREFIGRLGLPVTARVSPSLTRVDGPPGAYLARAEIDLTSPSTATVAVYGKTGEVVLRQSFARDSSAAVVREEVADAVRSAVEAQLFPEMHRALPVESAAPPASAAPIQPPPPPPPSAAPPPPPPVPTPPAPTPAPASTQPETTSSLAEVWRNLSMALDLDVLAGGGPFADNAGFIPRIGGGVVAASRRGLQPSLTVSGAYVSPFDAKTATSEISAHTSVSSYRAMAGVRVLRATWSAVDASVGGGFDVLNVDPQSAPDMADKHSTMRTEAIVSVGVAGHASLYPGVAFTLALGADANMSESQRYSVQTPQTGAAGTDVFVPWIVRPTAMAGFTFTALGERRFARNLLR